MAATCVSLVQEFEYEEEDEEWVVFLIMGSVLPGYMFRYQYCLLGGLEAIVFGTIRWYV